MGGIRIAKEPTLHTQHTSFSSPAIQTPLPSRATFLHPQNHPTLGDMVPSERKWAGLSGGCLSGNGLERSPGTILLVTSLREVPYISHQVLRVSWLLSGKFFNRVSDPRFPLLPRHGLKLQNSASMLGPWHSAPPKAAGGAVPALKRRRTPTLQLWLQRVHGVQGLQPQATAGGGGGDRCKKPGRVVPDSDFLGTPPTLPGGYLGRVQGLP